MLLPTPIFYKGGGAGLHHSCRMVLRTSCPAVGNCGTRRRRDCRCLSLDTVAQLKGGTWQFQPTWIALDVCVYDLLRTFSISVAIYRRVGACNRSTNDSCHCILRRSVVSSQGRLDVTTTDEHKMGLGSFGASRLLRGRFKHRGTETTGTTESDSIKSSVSSASLCFIFFARRQSVRRCTDKSFARTSFFRLDSV